MSHEFPRPRPQPRVASSAPVRVVARSRIKTWHLEMLAVGLVLSCVALVRGGWHEWLAAAAVLATFGHASVAERMRERDAARPEPEVSCHRWTWRYFVAKEALWIAFFLATQSYAALAGCGVFLAFPLWRRWWRSRNPLDRKVQHGSAQQEESTTLDRRRGEDLPRDR